MADEWHGRAADEADIGDVPPQPEDAAVETAEDLSGRGGVQGPFALVRFVGSYGIGCMQRQELEQRNISYGDAKEYAWQYFGLCGANVSFYDADGNFVETLDVWWFINHYESYCEEHGLEINQQLYI